MTAVVAEELGQDHGIQSEKGDVQELRVSFLDRLIETVSVASPEALGRAVFAVSALHAPDDAGRCRVCVECQPRRRFRADRPPMHCQTLLVLRFTLTDPSSVREAGR